MNSLQSAPATGGSQIGRWGWFFCGPRWLPRLGWLVAIGWMLSAVSIARGEEEDAQGSTASLHTAPCQTCQRNEDEIWLIDDRRAGCLESSAESLAELQFARYDMAQDSWRPADAKDFFAPPPAALQDCYWVHGDRIDPSEAKYAGLTVYRRLLEGERQVRPLRFVIWSWPTTQVYRRPIQDVRLKASRTPATGYRLAAVLSRMPQETPVGLIGYSFGARVITGALHVLGGGQLQGQGLEKPPANARFRAALLASAIDYDWLEPGEPHGLALKPTQQMLLVNNGCDRILAHYRLLACDRHGVPALGYCGVRSLSALGPAADRVRQFDACCEVGSQHLWRLYPDSESVMVQVRETILHN